MTTTWINFLNKINDQIKEFDSVGCDTVCFRGHANSNWDLLPTLLVTKEHHSMTESKIKNIEHLLYFDFVTNAGQLLKPNMTDWEILFLMRHHGVPTRILDWTENFGTALYFALNGDGNTPTIWMFNPYELNKISYKHEAIPNPMRDLEFSYNECYIENEKKGFENPIAIIPPRVGDRIFAQKGLFTIHGSNLNALNKNSEIKKCFKKFVIPKTAINDAKIFLKLAGINHYSIYPDLDGLSKHLVDSLIKKL